MRRAANARLFGWVLIVVCIGSSARADDLRASRIEFFEKRVRPVFAEHCYSCHGPKKQNAGLRLDTQAGFAKGTDAGPLVVPGKPDQSLLLRAVRHMGEAKMPPKSKLPDQVIADLAEWVQAGAVYPPDAATGGTATAARHWSFETVRRPAVPEPKRPTADPIDRFIQVGLEKAGVTPNDPADRRTLIRRITQDLTGLQPTAEETAAFIADQSLAAFAKVVDRLLQSPAYGEHQARRWMDLARYSDTKGYVFVEDRNYPYAYTYRDWLIRSFNEDLPYDQFLKNQIAADLQPGADKARLAALGFLTLGRRFLNNQADIIDDRMDVTFRTFQGLTITCARCHDHKYDPIPIADYYSIYGVFASTIEPKDLPLLGDVKRTPELEAFETELKKRETAATESWESLKAAAFAKQRSAESVSAYLRAVRDGKSLPSAVAGMIAVDRKLIAFMLDRWKNYLDGRERLNDPVLSVYFRLGAVADKDFATKSPALLQELLKSTDAKVINPVVAQAFAGKNPANFAEVCDILGKVIAAHWPLPKGASGPAVEQLHAVLGTNGPMGMDDKQLERIIAIKEKNVVRDLRRKVEEWKAKAPAAPPRAMAVADAPRPTQPVVFLRGNPNNRGPAVPRQYLGFLTPDRKPFTDGSGRREMADRMGDPRNPLTARVMVNRIWAGLFGKGIVRTPSDFGVRSDTPTHPELLDYLADTFVADGWSVKKLVRRIVLTEAYRRGSQVSEASAKNDPENRLLGRMNRKRITFEQLRDGLLQSAGRLDTLVGGKSVDLFTQPFARRRAVYGFIDRQNLPGTFRTFDMALPDTHAPLRFTTTVPQQALFLMNAPFVQEQAKATAARLTATEPTERIRELFLTVYGRTPDESEIAAALEFTKSVADPVAKMSTFEQLAQVLLLSNEFAFVE